MMMAVPVLAQWRARFCIGPLHFGFMFLTPSVGATLFAVYGVSKTSIEDVTKELWPFPVGGSACSW
jgi:TRAP-type C4-dicarboxylate transport system permease large subunit